MLARQYIPLELDDEDLRSILLNAHINDHFLSLAREVWDTEYFIEDCVIQLFCLYDP